MLYWKEDIKMALIDNPISSITDAISKVLDRVLPNKEQNDAAKAQLLQIEVQGQIQEVLAQIQVNAVEAQSQSTFVSGWRPYVGWICGTALAYATMIQPLITLIVRLWKPNFEPLVIDNSQTLTVLMGLLGLGVMRSIDKNYGTDSGH